MTNPSDFSQVLERLLCSLVDNKRAVAVDFSQLQARVNWSFVCDVADIGKIVGKGGSRLRALRLILELVGQQSGSVQWYLEQPGDLPGERRNGRHDAQIPDSHNPQEDFDLLKDLLLALGVNARCVVIGDVNEGFLFIVYPDQIQDATAITEPHEARYSVAQREVEPLTPLEAITSVMKAIGAVQGCKYWVKAG